jgi:phosphoribosylglycinamide formyltransferase-1
VRAERLAVGVLISGRGSNLEALLAAAADPLYPARIACVVSNRADARGLIAAERAGAPAFAIPHGDYPDRAAFEAAVDETLRAHEVGLVALAGFMRVLTNGFLARWPGAVMNIHPSLLPAFPGLQTHARAIAAGCKLHGCTVHFVWPEVDSGPIIAQAAVPVLDDDGPDALAERVLAQEHRLYPAAVRAYAEGRLAVDGRRVRWR